MKASELMLRLTEVELQQKITDLAELRGWLVYHTYDSRRSAAGFPDLVLCRSGQVLFVEVKSEKGRLSKAQAKWLTELGIGTTLQFDHFHEVYIWRPSDMADIEDCLA